MNSCPSVLQPVAIPTALCLLLVKNVNIEMFKIVILPLVLYGCVKLGLSH
jgi:hypothetical protein